MNGDRAAFSPFFPPASVSPAHWEEMPPPSDRPSFLSLVCSLPFGERQKTRGTWESGGRG